MKFKRVESKGGSSEGSSRFLKIKSGESVKGVCRGEVYEFYQKWENGKSISSLKPQQGFRPKWRVNFIVFEAGAPKSKILEFGPMISNQLAALSEDYNLSETIIKISKTGSGMDTDYSVIPLKDKPFGEYVELQILDLKESAQVIPREDAPMPEDEF